MQRRARRRRRESGQMQGSAVMYPFARLQLGVTASAGSRRADCLHSGRGRTRSSARSEGSDLNRLHHVRISGSKGWPTGVKECEKWRHGGGLRHQAAWRKGISRRTGNKARTRSHKSLGCVETESKGAAERLAQKVGTERRNAG